MQNNDVPHWFKLAELLNPGFIRKTDSILFKWAVEHIEIGDFDEAKDTMLSITDDGLQASLKMKLQLYEDNENSS